MRLPARAGIGSLVLALAFGCGAEVTPEDGVDEACLHVEPLADAGRICRVLPSGLVIAPEGTLHMLLDEGTLAPIATLPLGVECTRPFAHDVEAGKLWWIEPGSSFADPPTPTRLHRFDLALGSEDAQFELDYPGHQPLRIRDLRHRAGGIDLAGTLVAEGPSEQLVALIERRDAAGTVEWTRIGPPGFGFDGQPAGLHEAFGLMEVSTGLAYVGVVTGIDSSAWTQVSAEPSEGAPLWSTLVVSDDFGKQVRVGGEGDMIVRMIGVDGGYLYDPETLDIIGIEPDRIDLVATTPLGEPLWQIDDVDWPGVLATQVDQAVLDERVVHLARDDDGEARLFVRDRAGTLTCARDLPELAGLGVPSGVQLWPVRGQRVVVVVQVGASELALVVDA